MPSPIESALQILTKAKEDIQQALAGHEMETNSIFILSVLTRTIDKLSFQLGLTAGTTAAETTQTFAPVTEFFGEPIERAGTVVEGDLNPTPTVKEKYVARVNQLQQAFNEHMQPESIISSYSQPEDEQVLRGVAKRAGLEDYETGTINIDFVERIKTGLNDAEKALVEEAKINAELEGTNEAAPAKKAPAKKAK